MMRYIAIAGLVGSLVLSGVAWWQYARATSFKHQRDIMQSKLDTCDARARNAKEAKKDAETVDAWGDLLSPPNGWILPEAGAGD